MTITVISPKDIDVQFRDFWMTYGQFIGIFAGAFVGVLAKELFDIRKKQKKKNE